MKTHYGNYLGIVITGGEKDPEGRGRCQIFIPHIMPTLYDGWNREGQDISFDIVGNGLPESLNPDIVNTLQKILPWAECAAPIVGSSPSVKNGSEIERNTAQAMSQIAGLGPGFNFGGDIADDDIVLQTVTGRDSWEGAQCGKDAREVLSKIYSYEVEGSIDKLVPGKVPASGANGKNYAKILQNLGWTKVSDNPADVKPLTIGVWGSGPYGHVATGVKLDDGRTGWVGGSKSITTPDSAKFTSGGGSTTNAADGSFLGLWAPPPEVAEKVGSQLNAGQPDINPSGIAGGPIPVGTNMDQPPNNQPNYDTPPSIDTSNMSDAFKSQYERVYNALEGSKFIGTIPADGAKYGITTGSREEWAHMFTRLASTESGFNTNTAADINGGRSGTLTSFGLYQIGSTQFDRHGGGDIYNPDDNTNAFVNYAEEMYFGDTYGSGGNNVIGARGGSNGWLGLAAAYGPIRRITDGRPDENQKQLLAENISAAETQTGDYTANNLASNQQSIQNPTQHAASPGPDTNYQALGMFGYASEGTTVWVFFREGNPLFPVYFAASYGQREWRNMYSYSSPDIGAGAGTGALPGTEKMRLNSYGGGFESIQVSKNPESGLDPQFTFQVYGKNGSNLLFTKDHTEFNSTYNHNQRVAGDFHEITEANKEERVRGDKNSYIEQDVYITIGNWTDEAIAASDEIQQYINEAMEIKSNAGKA